MVWCTTVIMETIQQKIAARKARLLEIDTGMRRLERDRLVVETEIKTYEDALTYIAQHDFQPTASATPPIKPRRQKKGGGAARTLTGQWIETMKGVGLLPSFDAGDVIAAANERGHSPNRATVRSQIFNYKKRGLVAAKPDGRYSFTDLGRQELNLPSNESTKEERSSHRDETVS